MNGSRCFRLNRIGCAILVLLFFSRPAAGQRLSLPLRPENARGATELIDTLTHMTRQQRECAVLREILSGNVPSFERQFVPVTVIDSATPERHCVTFFAMPDYLAIGSDTDHLLMPMTPSLAQHIATTLGCVLPTRTMVDEVYAHATIRLRPQPIPPSPAMSTMPLFVQHNDSIRFQRSRILGGPPPGELTAGHKKDIIISHLMKQRLKKDQRHPVVIYGWHQPDGVPIQPPFNGHGETYVDYSHGVRLVLDSIIVDGHPSTVNALLRDPRLAPLLSGEGVISEPSYRITDPDSVRWLEP